MNTIFIPVLFICINSNCEFMQATNSFKFEKECREGITIQKKYMTDMVKKVELGKIDLMEGTCIDANVPRGLTISENHIRTME